MNISELVGKTLKDIQVSADEIIFTTAAGQQFIMYHDQECCESVEISDINGDWEDLQDMPILKATEETNSEDLEHGDSCTWTFYRISTFKGTVVITWYGTSNGYYSESVTFKEITD